MNVAHEAFPPWPLLIWACIKGAPPQASRATEKCKLDLPLGPTRHVWQSARPLVLEIRKTLLLRKRSAQACCVVPLLDRSPKIGPSQFQGLRLVDRQRGMARVLPADHRTGPLEPYWRHAGRKPAQDFSYPGRAVKALEQLAAAKPAKRVPRSVGVGTTTADLSIARGRALRLRLTKR